MSRRTPAISVTLDAKAIADAAVVARYFGLDPTRGRSEAIRRALAAAAKSIDPRPAHARELESIRRAAGLSQAQLGARCGLARSTVAMLEQGRAALSEPMAQRLAEAAGADPAPLLRAIAGGGR